MLSAAERKLGSSGTTEWDHLKQGGSTDSSSSIHRDAWHNSISARDTCRSRAIRSDFFWFAISPFF